MSVCRRWHELMELSPELWTSFTIGKLWGDQSKENTLMPKTESIELWQARSQNRPIYIHIYNGNFTARSKDGITMMTTLLPSIKRWRRLDLELDQNAAEAFIIHNHPTTAGSEMQEIRVSTSCEKAETNNQLLVAIGHWPSLSKLIWVFATGFLITSQPTFQNTLHLFPCSATSAEVIRLNMQEYLTDSPAYHACSAIDLPNLRYLGIESDSSMYRFVECLNLPGIEGVGLFQKTLSLENSWGPDPHPVIPSSKFQQFLNRMAQSAQTMIIHGYPFTSRDAIDFIGNQELPNIVVLEIDVGEMASVAVMEYMESYSPTNRQIKSSGGKLLGWCYDHAKCNTFREILPSFSNHYHMWHE
ncbi:hypothetical protein AGABI2DRAFT_120583 [Agaricus bisporus var. bisporus H97]|uniref:hypothetical protein n=1 Tax=Agaricus bisporus var. bisporus (strain H97 / ATCC MYA-4626 / FGSC 10389) TaxID=936046 RepID=UPI00029F79A4|nr:hypothetical protein AGABI2DRAFT_120583 [Agaricus bisporus var. bisporus H97]EKV44455.1 hypothetical protein AGABI2DRAFT_120583 [Agaricus bisporus var. bisporus H97]